LDGLTILIEFLSKKANRREAKENCAFYAAAKDACRRTGR
jgi:hypothetical protein